MDITYSKYLSEKILGEDKFYINVISKYKQKGCPSLTESIAGLGDVIGRRYNKNFVSVSKNDGPAKPVCRQWLSSY